MTDRQPMYPGRINLKKVETGETALYDITMADEPTEEGDAPIKKNLLTDMTCDLLGIDRSSVVNDAFIKLALGAGNYGYQIHVQYQDGTPMKGISLSGVTAIGGGSLVTDENGDALGVSTQNNPTISASSGYIDIPSVSKKIESTGTITEVLLEFAPTEGYTISRTSTSSFTVSPYVKTVDLCAVGGGQAGQQGGGSTYSQYGGAGGAGGKVANVMGLSLPKGANISCTIGAGGTGNGGTGGTTSISIAGTVRCTAAGGTGYGGLGGTSNGNAVNGSAGNSNSVNKFNDPSLGLAGGGDGGGGAAVLYGSGGGTGYGGSGGSPYGGSGGSTGSAGSSARGYGGGGGGGSATAQSFKSGGSGMSGVAYIRLHY